MFFAYGAFIVSNVAVFPEVGSVRVIHSAVFVRCSGKNNGVYFTVVFIKILSATFAMIVRGYTFLGTSGCCSFHPHVVVQVFGRSRFCYDKIGKTTRFKRKLSVSHGRNKVFYRVVILNVENKVVIHLNVGYGNKNLYLAARLYLCAVFRNVNIENINAAVLVVVPIGNCRKHRCAFFCGCRDYVANQGRTFFKAAAVNNNSVFVLQLIRRYDSVIARRKR